jgi:predicted TIM-barrel fold metal-dependent hydrolase
MTAEVSQTSPPVTDRSDPLLESISGIKVLDVDTHLTEPGDLWTSRAPAKYKDLVPRVEVFKEGVSTEFQLGPRHATEGTHVWVVGENAVLGFAGGGSVVNRHNVKVHGEEFMHWPLTEVSPAASFIEPRLAIMDEVGIWGQIVYPNVVGFGGQQFSKILDPKLRNLCATIWNDAMAEMQEESGGRINGLALIPWWDRDFAVKEIERVHALGLHGINTNADPQNHGMPDLADPYWEPVWEACASLGLPINFHIGSSVSQLTYVGSAPWPSFDDATKIAIGSTVLYIANTRVLANMIFSGVLDRHPTLKVVSVESGVGWIPFALEALDYQAVENGVGHHLSMKPSEYFARQIYACFWFEGKGLVEDVNRLGVDNCMFETDFPHPTCLYPQPLNGVAKVLEDVDYASRAKLLGGNAARVYGIDLPLPTPAGTPSR